MTQGGSVTRSSRSDDHNTAHGYVLRRVVSRLIRISLFPFVVGVLTSSLNNKSASEREKIPVATRFLQPYGYFGWKGLEGFAVIWWIGRG